MPSSELLIKVAKWEQDKEILSGIRRIVFIEEQNVPEELEWDEFDTSASHFLAVSENKNIACARLKRDGQLGRMAVLAEYRNQGVGKKLLQFILQHAAQQQFDQLYLHAQVDAINFYEKQGFVTKGDVFYEANIPHREMLKKVC